MYGALNYLCVRPSVTYVWWLTLLVAEYGCDLVVRFLPIAAVQVAVFRAAGADANG